MKDKSSADKLSSMMPGQYLEPGQMLVSTNKAFVLVYQTDGNLVLYAVSDREKVPRWSSRTNGSGAYRVRFENNGDLVVYAAEGVEVWRSPVWRGPTKPKRMLCMQDDGNLVAYELIKAKSIPTPDHAYWATSTWEAFNTYALLIGVEAYGNFQGQELLAGRNDVLALWQVCRRLGYKPENIRICTSPLLEMKQILEAEVALALSFEENLGKTPEVIRKKVVTNFKTHKPTLGDATYQNIRDAVGWLGERLGEPFRAQKGFIVPAILGYSGHGIQVDGELGICPTDVKKTNDGKGVENVLKFSEIQKILCAGDTNPKDDLSPVKYLTTVLDCCFAGGASVTDDARLHKDHRVTSLTPATTNSNVVVDVKPIFGQRIFCASRFDEQGYQALLGGRWHGAFTWAFTQALEQWKVEKKAELYLHSNVSHAELLFRARMLLDALSFRQHPILMDSISNTPAFWGGAERVENEKYSSDDLELSTQRNDTSAEPDRARAGIQLDPNRCKNASYAFYTFTLTYKDANNQSQQATAYALVPSATKGTSTFAEGTEYWQIPPGFSTTWKATLNNGTAQRLDVAAKCGNWSSDPKASYSPSFSKTAAISSTSYSWTATSPPSTVLWNNNVGIDFSNDSVNWYYQGANAPNSTTTYLVGSDMPFTPVQLPSGTSMWVLTQK